MAGALYGIARRFAFGMDPERAHELSLRALELGLAPLRAPYRSASLAVEAFGLTFPNPIGLAAGYDKDARVPDAMLAFGFGHVEIGSVTPRPQPGNARPRLFRLPADLAVINRMGFNSAGHGVVAQRLGARTGRPGIVAVNLGANKETADKAEDFAAGVEQLGPFAGFLTVNISSPNTPGLRDLQLPGALARLLDRLQMARRQLKARHGASPALIVKLAPDIYDADLAGIVTALLAGGCQGIAVSNTTVARSGLVQTALASQDGGLSGRPLFTRSTRMLARLHVLTGGKIPLIGIGGVMSGETAAAKIAAGASLVQLYTGLIYEGPALADSINRYLANELHRLGLSDLQKLRGTAANSWADARI